MWQESPIRGLAFLPRFAKYLVHRYIGTMKRNPKHIIERVQTGVRMEKRLLKVLRALADYHDMTLGDLLEGVVLHAFDGKCPFHRANLQRIKELKKFYGLDLNSGASHRLTESAANTEGAE
jgi:hypothetical protein